MRVLNLARIDEACRSYPTARTALHRWLRIAQEARWRHFADLRQTDRTVDQVKIAGGVVVTVFNIRGNSYRLITQITYSLGIVLIRDFLSHAEYDKNKWKV